MPIRHFACPAQSGAAAARLYAVRKKRVYGVTSHLNENDRI